MRINAYNVDPNPIGRTKLINDLITQLQSNYTYLDKDSNPLNWVERYYGLARIEELEGQRFPVVMDGNEYTTVQPNDNYKSICFFYDEGQGTFISGGRRLEHTFNMIVWYCRDAIDTKGYEIIDHAIRDAYEIVRKQHFEPLEVLIGRDNVFSQFSLNQFDERFMTAPFNAFRLRFTGIEECDYRRRTNTKFQSNL